VVQVSDIRHLFVAPDVDPFSQREGEAIGEPALRLVVRKLMAARKMRGAHKRLWCCCRATGSTHGEGRKGSPAMKPPQSDQFQT
jgi:hypothetical protein